MRLARQRRFRDKSARDDKSRWVAELEQALLAGEIDLAVHSAKDIPVDLTTAWSCSAPPIGPPPRTR